MASRGASGAVLQLRVAVIVARPDGLRGSETKALDTLAWYAEVAEEAAALPKSADVDPTDSVSRLGLARLLACPVIL